MHFLQQLVEYKEWGWNATTISFLGTLVLGFVFGWGQWRQIQTIRYKQSGKSIPMKMVIYFTFHFFAFSVYGFRVHSIAIMLNGIFGVLYLLTYIEANKWPDSAGRTPWEYACAPLPVAMYLISDLETFMAALFLVASTFLIQAPLEIRRKKDAGAVEPAAVKCFIASAVFWMVFSLCISKWVLFTANIFGIGVMIWVLRLHARFGKVGVRAHVQS